MYVARLYLRGSAPSCRAVTRWYTFLKTHELTPICPLPRKNYAVVVVGSCNMDQIAYIPRFPGAGETIHGSKYLVSDTICHTFPGYSFSHTAQHDAIGSTAVHNFCTMPGWKVDSRRGNAVPALQFWAVGNCRNDLALHIQCSMDGSILNILTTQKTSAFSFLYFTFLNWLAPARVWRQRRQSVCHGRKAWREGGFSWQHIFFVFRKKEF